MFFFIVLLGFPLVVALTKVDFFVNLATENQHLAPCHEIFWSRLKFAEQSGILSWPLKSQSTPELGTTGSSFLTNSSSIRSTWTSAARAALGHGRRHATRPRGEGGDVLTCKLKILEVDLCSPFMKYARF